MNIKMVASRGGSDLHIGSSENTQVIELQKPDVSILTLQAQETDV